MGDHLVIAGTLSNVRPASQNKKSWVNNKTYGQVKLKVPVPALSLKLNTNEPAQNLDGGPLRKSKYRKQREAHVSN